MDVNKDRESKLAEKEKRGPKLEVMSVLSVRGGREGGPAANSNLMQRRAAADTIDTRTGDERLPPGRDQHKRKPINEPTL